MVIKLFLALLVTTSLFSVEIITDKSQDGNLSAQAEELEEKEPKRDHYECFSHEIHRK